MNAPAGHTAVVVTSLAAIVALLICCLAADKQAARRWPVSAASRGKKGRGTREGTCQRLGRLAALGILEGQGCSYSYPPYRVQLY